MRLASQRLFLVAADLGRDSSGQWKVISDRTQAPSGAGYAMQNRRVVSRVMPEIYQQANLHRLTPFFQAMRLALVDAAPSAVEDPRVVVLSPGTLSETAFDQAFVASLLGFPVAGGQRPDRSRRPGLDAGTRQAGAGRRDPAPGRLARGWMRSSCAPTPGLVSPDCWNASARAPSAWSTTSAPGSWRIRR